MDSLNAFDLADVCAELLIDVVMGSLVEKVDIHLSEHRAERVGVALVPAVA